MFEIIGGSLWKDIVAGQLPQTLSGTAFAVTRASLDDRLGAPSGLAGLLPEGGFRRGSCVEIEGSVSLALAIAAMVSKDGGWCAAISPPTLGFLAVAELGVDLNRFVVADARTPADWVRATNALLEGCDLVLAWPLASLQRKPAERLIAIARERGAILLLAGPGWPVRTDLTLSIGRVKWLGLGLGSGRLAARRVEVIVSGRGAASLERRGFVWLPDANGETEEFAEIAEETTTPLQAAR